MNRTVLPALLACFASLTLNAQFPSLNDYSVSGISKIGFDYSRSAGKGKNKTEVPPWIIPGGLRSYFFVDGSDTYIWSSASSLVHDRSLDLDNAVGPALASVSYIHTPNFHPSVKIKNWKRNYHAIYSAAYIKHPIEGPVTLGFLHGENKNQVVGRVGADLSQQYQNTIQPHVVINPADHNTYSGGQPFIEGWLAYNATISAAWVKNDATTNWGQQLFQNGLGPIAWPSTAYITNNGIKSTSGLKHPSSIIADGYVYVFFADGGPYGNNIPHEEGRLEGIKVVRAPLADALDAKAYKIYYKDSTGTDTWHAALPAGFTKETMLEYVAVKGPRSTDLMNDVRGLSQHIRFSVAKVRGKNYYIGVEEYIDIADAMKFKVALRYSDDLVTWSERELVVAEAADWESTKMNYPVFLDKEGWTNTEIDLNDFYILGTGPVPDKHVNRIHLKAAQTTGLLTTGPSGSLRRIRQDMLYPNPNYGSLRVSYSISEPSRVKVSLFSLSGTRLGVLANQLRNSGTYADNVNMAGFSAGTYVLEVTTNTSRKLYQVVKL